MGTGDPHFILIPMGIPGSSTGENPRPAGDPHFILIPMGIPGSSTGANPRPAYFPRKISNFSRIVRLARPAASAQPAAAARDDSEADSCFVGIRAEIWEGLLKRNRKRTEEIAPIGPANKVDF